LFGLFKKTLSLLAPVSGKVIDLSEVPDATFAEKLVGDGIAIEATSDTISAPIDGELVMIFRTNHAFAIKTEHGIELLIHVGIETVGLNGEGFERLKQEGSFVKAGEPILKVDKPFMDSKGISLLTPVIITNPTEVKEIEYFVGKEVTCGKDVVLTYKLK
jgi:glucose-specific phosphotransferase system IIA component